MRMSNKSIVQICSWLLAGLVTLLAVAAWMAQARRGGLTAYTVFPLLGLLAFSLMWTHYLLGVLRRLLGVEAAANSTYFKLSGIVVLLLILLHPGLLIAALYKDGFGLPPESYFSIYGEPVMKGAIMLGTASLFIFLAFELKNRFKGKSWWKYVDYAQVLAMFLIFYHGLTLGGELAGGWYRTAWYAYGFSLFSAILFNYWYDRKARLTNGGEHGKS